MVPPMSWKPRGGAVMGHLSAEGGSTTREFFFRFAPPLGREYLWHGEMESSKLEVTAPPKSDSPPPRTGG